MKFKIISLFVSFLALGCSSPSLREVERSPIAELKLHDVRDLVQIELEYVHREICALPLTYKLIGEENGNETPLLYQAEELVQMVMNATAPEVQTKEFKVSYLNGQLIVRTIPQVHDQVSSYLETLRPRTE